MLPKIEDLKPIFMMEMVKERFKREDPLEYFLRPPSDEEDRNIWRGKWGTVAEQLFSKEEQENLAPLVAGYLPKLTSFDRLDPVTKSMLGFFARYGKATVYEVAGWTYLIKYRFQGAWQYALVGQWMGGSLKINPRDFAEHVANRGWRKKGEESAGWIFLTNRLTQAVQQTYDRASSDFDNACVVTSDGKHIIKAEKVRIVRPDGTMREVDASLFRENKILFPDSEEGGDWIGSTVKRDAIGRMEDHVRWLFCDKPKYGGFFLRPWDKGDFPSIFFVRERLIPTGLALAVQ